MADDIASDDHGVDPRPELITAAQHFYSQGWMVGTAGNLSARLLDGSLWITASGCAKGALELDDFIQLAANGQALQQPSGSKPSAETSIHQVLYALFPEAQACYHVHSIEANLVSRFTQADSLPLPPLEMLKGLGVWQENPQCAMPIFANHGQVSRIGSEIRDRFQANLPEVPALLLRDHGVTVWAPSLVAARNYIELVAYLFRYMVAARQVGICEQSFCQQ